MCVLEIILFRVFSLFVCACKLGIEQNRIMRKLRFIKYFRAIVMFTSEEVEVYIKYFWNATMFTSDLVV